MSRILILFLFLLKTNTAMAWGVHLGVYDGTVSTSPNPTSSQSTARFILGVHQDMALNSSFIFEPGLQYAQRGYKATVVIDGNSYTSNAYYSSIEVPLLARWKYSDFLPELIAGPDVQFNLGASCDLGSTLTCSVVNVSPFTVAINGGLVKSFRAFSTPMALHARYFQQWTSVSSTNEIHLHGFEFLLGMDF